MRKRGIYGSAGQSLKWIDPMTIMQIGMTTVTLQAIVQPMVPNKRRSNLAKKSMKFREALCVSRIRPKSES